MNYTADEDKEFSICIKPDKRCYSCNVPIYFTSKEAETPTGRPTKDPITGKVIPLDPATYEYHRCKPEDIEAFKHTDERRKKTAEWLSKIQSSQEAAGSSSTNRDATNNNNYNNVNLTLEKILTTIEHLERMQTDCKGEIAVIKNELKIGVDRSPSDEKQGSGGGS